ncbi:type II toxin-antitoxin system PemK/MazF family toxin [Cellulomonas sp. KRMCY2]|uniref:type II toxin-antitoxin system PemK/MazF family toxin n=1 Tax=Cellulomonas sp. KRMCY2 TaxID=1304865 RepID=UPI00045EB89A|nr:type II toxin-antitoxin system PemK/MazF family toxin [Cellulomonas sp. KRMCY2]
MSTSSLVARLLGATVRGLSGVTAKDRRGSSGDGRASKAKPVGRAAAAGYPGDFTGVVHPVYAPHRDGSPDPGEIVWTWVPYEEDATRGKDRPVLLVGHDGDWLLGLILSSRDHDAQPARNGETWIDLGVGDWDSRRRPSEVRLDRILRLDPAAVRREGSVLDRTRFAMISDRLG